MLALENRDCPMDQSTEPAPANEQGDQALRIARMLSHSSLSAIRKYPGWISACSRRFECSSMKGLLFAIDGERAFLGFQELTPVIEICQRDFRFSIRE